MNDRSIKNTENLVEPLVIVLPSRMVRFLDVHAKKIGVTPSAIIKGALSVYKIREGIQGKP
jgi:hypothetical protein